MRIHVLVGQVRPPLIARLYAAIRIAASARLSQNAAVGMNHQPRFTVNQTTQRCLNDLHALHELIRWGRPGVDVLSPQYLKYGVFIGLAATVARRVAGDPDVAESGASFRQERM
jgi:hypothetical protein